MLLQSSDDEPSEEKDCFVAQLYKFMDDRGNYYVSKQRLGDLLFLLRFVLLLFFFSFLSLAHELVHGRSQELLDIIS